MLTEAPRRVRHLFVQTLVAPPATVFPLLCPVRELEWVPGWNPERVISRSGVAELDCVFTTKGDGGIATWVVTKYDPRRWQLEMVKVTPGHTVGKLEISLRSDAAGNETRAEVVYTYTSLGPAGDEFVAGFTKEAYDRFQHNWEKAMNHYLTTGKKYEPS